MSSPNQAKVSDFSHARMALLAPQWSIPIQDALRTAVLLILMAIDDLTPYPPESG